METIGLDISPAQFKKLVSGQAIQLKNHAIGNGSGLKFSARNAKKLLNAYQKGVGARVNLTQSEAKANSALVGGKFSIGKAIKKTKGAVNKGAKYADQANDYVAKADSVIQKVDRIVDKGEIIGDLGIPYVSAGYNALDMATDRMATASAMAKEVSDRGNTAVQSGNNLTQDPSLKNLNRTVRDGKKARSAYDDAKSGAGWTRKVGNAKIPIGGKGVDNQYMPRKGRKTGGSFKPIGGRGNVKLQTDDSNIVGPHHNSFNPIPPESYSRSGHTKCPCCGK